MLCTKRKATCSGTLKGIGVPSAYWASTDVSAGSPAGGAAPTGAGAAVCAARAAGALASHAQTPSPANIHVETHEFFNIALTSAFLPRLQYVNTA
jgi:hypothetical protein